MFSSRVGDRVLSLLLRTAIVILPLLFCTARVEAQVLYGSMAGNVVDSAGGAIGSARVQALNVATGAARTAVTDSTGVFQINDLQAGTYKVTISSPAFATVIQTGVQVDANAVKRVDAQLQPAQVSQTITVDASAAVLQTDRADVNTQLRSSQITQLPVGGARNFQSLFKLVPGSSPPAASHSEAGNPVGALATNVNGASYNNNNTRIDGTNNLYPWLPEIIAYVPPAEAIENVNIETASFDAEQGLAGGSAVNIAIKSGTNDFHGSAWEFNTISALKARNFYYYGANNPKYILNQFGVTIGGPIVKNKLFFFTDWERTERRQSVSGFQTVPTDAIRQGNFTGTGTVIYNPATGNPATGSGRTPFPNAQVPASLFSAAAVKMTSLIPQPNQPGFPNNYFASGSYSFSRDVVDAKVNYNPSEKTAIFGRYSTTPYDIFDPPALGPAGGNTLDGGQPGNANGMIQSVALGGTHSFTPTVLLDGNIGYTRQRLSGTDVDINKNYGLEDLSIPGTNGSERLQGGYPKFDITGFSSLGNPNNSNPFVFRDNQYTAAVNLSVIKGSHSLRFGGEYFHFGINHFQPQVKYGPRGGFTFTGGLTALNGGVAPTAFNSYADFLLGQAQSLGKDYQYINPATVRESTYGLYARDQWQVSRKLTLNYGLRYELYPIATRDNYGANLYDPVTNQVLIGGVGGVPHDAGENIGWGQLAPRVGLAYRFDDKTVVRAGFGISIDPNNFRSMRDAYPATISQQLAGANSFTAAGNLSTGIPAAVFPSLTGPITLPPDYGTTTFPRDFNRGYIESYNLTIQRDLFAGLNLQAAYVGTRAIRQSAFVNLNAGSPGLGKAGQPLYVRFKTSATINDVEPFNTATYNGLQTQMTERMRNGLSFGIVYSFSKAINYADNSDSGISFDRPIDWARNKALAGFDRTHNFQAYGSYEFPFGPGKPHLTQGFKSAVLGGWQLNWVLSRTSGTPFTVTTSGASLNAPGNTQTADQILPTVAVLGGHDSSHPYFDPNAFAPVTTARFGTSGRNIVRGPGLFNLDASVFRNFRLTERFLLQFRAEAFGLTNTPQFSNPSSTNLTASNASRNTNGTITALNGFGVITSSSGERQLRFALKFSF
jgi:hypothetical protein